MRQNSRNAQSRRLRQTQTDLPFFVHQSAGSVLNFPAMRMSATLLLLLLRFVCVGCGTIAWQVLPNDPICAMISLRALPVGHVINESDVMTTRIGTSHRDLFHPFRPRPNEEFTTDASKIVGHSVNTLILAHQAISPRRDLR